MTSWTSEQLDRIAAADELTIATPRLDGTLRRPVPIWVVRHGEALYVRSYRGQEAVWYQSARAHGQGRISAGGVDADVTFVEITDDYINAEVDASYRNKYARYGPRFLDPMVAPTARETTLKLAPQGQPTHETSNERRFSGNRRQQTDTTLGTLMPDLLAVPALTAVALISAGCWLVVGYEAIRHREARGRLRRGEELV